MTDSTISDLIYARLERNAERRDEISALDFGLGIPREHYAEYRQLPSKQARLRTEYADALRAEGKKVDDSVCLFAAEPETSVPGLRIENRGSAIRIFMYGEIGVDFTADDLKNEMQRYPSSPIELHVNSEGGSVVDGVAIHELIRSHAAPVDVTVDSLAASAASFSIMGSSSISMALGSYMMVHFASASLSNATQADFEAAAKRMKEVNATLKKFYTPRWKGSEAQLDKALAEERYFSAEESVLAGLADRVLTNVSRVAACVGSRFQHEGVPASLAIAARAGAAKFLNQPSRQMTLHRIITSTEET